MRFLALLGIAGCAHTGETVLQDQLLEAGFEGQIRQGWACEGWGMMGPPPGGSDVLPVSYYALDQGEHFRLQVHLPDQEAEFSPALDLQGSTFLVYTGANLIVDDGNNKCDDVVDVTGVAARTDAAYRAVAGFAQAVRTDEGFGLRTEGIVLRQDNSLLGVETSSDSEVPAEITMQDGLLPSMPLSTD